MCAYQRPYIYPLLIAFPSPPFLNFPGALFGCTVGTFVYAGEHYLYKHLYLMGMVASAYITRDFSLVMMKFLTAFCNP